MDVDCEAATRLEDVHGNGEGLSAAEPSAGNHARVGGGLGAVAALREELGAAALWQAAPRGATKIAFPQGSIIRTILKDVPPEALGTGATLFHEHLSLWIRCLHG